MADTKITISAEILDNISASLNKISKNVQSFGKTSEDSFNKAATGVTAISTGFLAVSKAVDIAGKALNGLFGIVKESVKQAAEQERAEALLISTLRQRGILTREVLQANLALAESLSRVTTFQDDQIIQAQRVLLQMGVQQSQIEDVTKATLDFAVATGKDLNSAAQLVGKSIGTSTNALSRYGIQMSGVSGSSGRAAEAVQKLNQAFGGSAAASANTFAGAVQQLNNQIDDTYKAFGQAFVQNTAVIGSIKLISDAFIQLQDYIKQNQETIMAFVKEGILFLIKSLNLLISVLNNVTNAFKFFTGAVDETDKLERTLLALEQRLRSIQSGGTKIRLELGGVTEAEIKEQISKIQNQLEKTQANKKLNIFEESQKILKQLEEGIEKLPVKKTIELEQKVTFEKSALTFGQIIEKAAVAVKETLSSIDIAGATQLLAGGKGGGEKLVGTLTKNIGTAIGGPVGGQIGELVGFLGRDQKEVQAAIDGFIKAIVEFPINLAKNIPYLIRALIEAIPQLIDALNEMIPVLIDTLVMMLSDPAFWESIIKAAISIILLTLGNPMFWINIAMALIKALILGVPAMVAALVQGIGNSIGKAFGNLGKVFSEAANVFSGAVNFFKSIVEGMKSVVGGGIVKQAGGGIIGGIKKVGKFFGLAQGGTVPGGFTNDRFGPVALTSGENVMDYSLNKRMNEFLDNESKTPRTMNVTLQVGEKDLASVMLSLKQRGFRTA